MSELQARISHAQFSTHTNVVDVTPQGEELEEKGKDALAPQCVEDIIEEQLFDRRDLLEIVEDRYDVLSIVITAKRPSIAGMRSSATQLSPTSFSTASSTTPTASSYSARACAQSGQIRRPPYGSALRWIGGFVVPEVGADDFP